MQCILCSLLLPRSAPEKKPATVSIKREFRFGVKLNLVFSNDVKPGSVLAVMIVRVPCR